MSEKLQKVTSIIATALALVGLILVSVWSFGSIKDYVVAGAGAQVMFMPLIFNYNTMTFFFRGLPSELYTGFLGVPTKLMGEFSQNIFAWHPILMVGGFFLGQVFALNSFNLIPDKTAGQIVHMFWQLGAFCCMIGGLVAVVKFELHQWYLDDNYAAPTFSYWLPSLTTMHSWVGVMGVAMYGVSFLSSASVTFLSSFVPNFPALASQDFLIFHRLSGLIAIVLSASAIVSGVMNYHGRLGCMYYKNTPDNGNYRVSLDTPDYDPSLNYAMIPIGCRISHGMGIAVSISAVFTVLAVILKNKAITSEDKQDEDVNSAL